MNAKEAVKIIALVRELFPATAAKMGDYPAEAWGLALGSEDVPFDIAKIAVVEVAKSQPFIHVSDVLKAIERMRRISQRSVVHLIMVGDPPPETEAYLKHLRERQRQVRNLADQAIRDGALDFTGVDLAGESEDDMGEPTELPVNLARLTTLPAAPPRRELGPAKPGLIRRMVAAATPRPEAQPPKVDREPVDQLTDAELAERTAEQQRQKDALQKLIGGAA